MDATITLIVNGKERTVVTDPERPLLDVLREELHLTGTKYGCGEGRCGACTVLMNGRRVLSCVTPVAKADKKKITTIEGLEKEGALDPLQQTFIDEGAVQCGYCTPGMILSAKALLDAKPDPSNEEIKQAIRGNLCRCTGYTNIVRAIKTASDTSQKRGRN